MPDAMLTKLTDELVSQLESLTRLTEKVSEHVDHVPDLSRGFTLEEHARVTIALRAAREAVSVGKTRLTHALQKADEWFAAKIAAETGDVTYKTDTHSFRATSRGFFGAPSQVKFPTEFKELIDWLRANGEEARVDVLSDGRYALENFDEYCEGLLRDGKQLPPHVSGHLIDSVRVTKRT